MKRRLLGTTAATDGDQDYIFWVYADANHNFEIEVSLDGGATVSEVSTHFAFVPHLIGSWTTSEFISDAGAVDFVRCLFEAYFEN